MEPIKNVVGPFEIFSGFISGLPFLLFGYIVWNGQFDADKFINNVLMNGSFANLVYFIVLSYLLGTIAAPISYRYFKYAGKLFGKNYLYMEGILLGDWDKPFRKMSLDDFIDLPFEKRITYLVKRRYGHIEKLSHLNDYLLPYLRQDAMANAANADVFIALNIMHRNLSFGFMLVSISFVFLAFTSQQPWHVDALFCAFTLMVSVLTLLQAHTVRNWWTREAVLGFYNLELKCMSAFTEKPKKVLTRTRKKPPVGKINRQTKI